MTQRVDPMVAAAGSSLLVLGFLVYLLYREAHPAAERPVLVYCAAALKPAMQATAAEYERETRRCVEFRFGSSEDILSKAALSRDGDLFLPADDVYVYMAEAKGLIAARFPLARMRVVVLTSPGNPHHIARFEDLLASTLKLGLANPDVAAIGKAIRDHLRVLGKWDRLEANVLVMHSTVTDAANAVELGSNDAAVVWDVVASNYVGRNGRPDLAVVHLPELDGIVGRVELAEFKSAVGPGARRFARYVAAVDRGQRQFRSAGFADLEPSVAWTNEESGSASTDAPRPGAP